MLTQVLLYIQQRRPVKTFLAEQWQTLEKQQQNQKKIPSQTKNSQTKQKTPENIQKSPQRKRKQRIKKLKILKKTPNQNKKHLSPKKPKHPNPNHNCIFFFQNLSNIGRLQYKKSKSRNYQMNHHGT